LGQGYAEWLDTVLSGSLEEFHQTLRWPRWQIETDGLAPNEGIAAYLWDDAQFDELARLATDPRFGVARDGVILGMAKSKRLQAGDILIRLLDDPAVADKAVSALAKSKLRFPDARKGLERMIGDSRSWVRKDAKKALEGLGS
jgi:hypothetical protein